MGFTKHSEASKAKIRASKMGDQNPSKRPDVRAKMRAAKLGKPNSSSTKFKKGVHSWNYIEDRSRVKVSSRFHDDPLYKEWARAVKNRDGWKCKMLNADCNGKLEAHHILPWSKFPELRYNTNNGISLCRFHHPRKRADEVKLAPVFQDLLAKA